MIVDMQDFYSAMFSTVAPRRLSVIDRLEGKPAAHHAQALNEVLEALKSIPTTEEGNALLAVDPDTKMALDLTYEITELRKDILYLTKGENALLEYLTEIHTCFTEQVDRCTEYLTEHGMRSFVSDRDGTINNYCGRYLTSVQSVYNAVFLTRFARTMSPRAVILTSAPLQSPGLVDINVMPEGAAVLAGSKGREYLNTAGTRGAFPIALAQEKKIEELNTVLEHILERPDHRVFTLIGSGFQKKFGQTTVSRQDINKSIPAQKSDEFLKTIRDTVQQIDPNGEYFRIEDTGLDIEIMLTVKSESDSESLRDFDKGDGVRFLERELSLDMTRGPNLICGDTPSDVPMVRASMEMTPDTAAIFVTRKQDLRNQVMSICAGSVFVEDPDALVVALDRFSRT